MKHTACICLLSLFCLGLSACSEDKCPPDDNSAQGSQKALMATSACLSRADEFHACALSALEGFALTDNERASLSACGYQQAVPETTALDVFSSALAAVTSHCE